MAEGVLIGLEAMPVGGLETWRMTVDAFVGGRMVRYQLTGTNYRRFDRTLEDLASAIRGDRAMEVAVEFDRLDREAAAKIQPIMRELQRAKSQLLRPELPGA